jgi:ABC-2 type transport system permease protein
MAELLRLGKTRALRIGAIVRKEISNLIADRIALLILFLIPIIMISVVGASKPRADLAESTIWIIDQDNSTTSRKFIVSMKGTSLFGSSNSSNRITHIYGTGDLAPIEPVLGQENATGYVSLDLANKTLPTEYLDAFVIIPKGFEEDLGENGKTTIIVYYDAIDFKSRFIADAVILMGLTNVQLENLILERDVFSFPETRPRDITANFNILEIAAPMFFGLMLFFSINLVCTQCIVGDIPLQRLLTTPLYRSEVITGKVISYSIMSVFQIIITLILCMIFEVPMNSLLIDLFILLLINSFASVCIGVFISTISKTRLQASQMFLMFFFVMLILMEYVRNPTVNLFIPIEQARIGWSKLASRGSQLGDVWEPILYMLITGGFFYIITVIYIKYMKKEFV